MFIIKLMSKLHYIDIKNRLNSIPKKWLVLASLVAVLLIAFLVYILINNQAQTKQANPPAVSNQTNQNAKSKPTNWSIQDRAIQMQKD